MFGKLLFFFVRPKIEISYKVKNNRSDKLTCYTKICHFSYHREFSLTNAHLFMISCREFSRS